MIRRRIVRLARLAGFAAFGVMAMAMAMAAMAAPSAESREASENLQVLTWNVWHGTYRTERREKLRLPGESRNEQRARLASQAGVLRQAGADVLLLQEVPRLPATARHWARQFGGRHSASRDQISHYRAFYRVTDCGLKLFGIGIPTNVRSGLAILARNDLAPRRRGSVRLSGRWSHCSAWFGFQFREGRHALLAEIRLASSGRVLLMNTHLHNEVEMSAAFRQRLEEWVETGRLKRATLEKIRQAERRSAARKRLEIAALVSTIRRIQTGRPGFEGVILGGDLNVTPGSDAYRRLRSAGLVDAVGESEDMAPPTYDPVANRLASRISGASPGIPTFGDKRLAELARSLGETAPRRIDYIFVTENLSRRVRGSGLLGAAEGDAPPDLSDHFGVVVELEAGR